MLSISLRTGIPTNPEHLLPETSLGFEYMKQGKYISGDERGGFKVAKANLPLLDPRLRLFIQGKEDWLEEGLLVPTRMLTVYFGTPNMFITLQFGFDYGTNPPLGTLII
jgi:hypothetical protein